MIKRIISWATLFICLFLFQTIDAQIEEIPTPAIEQAQEVITEEPQITLSIEQVQEEVITEELPITLSIEELSAIVETAEKKLESIKKELRYTETLKGNKKYKKEIAKKFDLANNNLKLAKLAYETATNPIETEILEEAGVIDETSTEIFP